MYAFLFLIHDCTPRKHSHSSRNGCAKGRCATIYVSIYHSISHCTLKMLLALKIHPRMLVLGLQVPFLGPATPGPGPTLRCGLRKVHFRLVKCRSNFASSRDRTLEPKVHFFELLESSWALLGPFKMFCDSRGPWARRATWFHADASRPGRYLLDPEPTPLGTRGQDPCLLDRGLESSAWAWG